jgi:hypothetical protein
MTNAKTEGSSTFDSPFLQFPRFVFSKLEILNKDDWENTKAQVIQLKFPLVSKVGLITCNKITCNQITIF